MTRPALAAAGLGSLAFLLGVCFSTWLDGPLPRVPYETCRSDCEDGGRDLWAWAPERCECTP